MSDDLRDRIADQYSYRGERAEIWRAFDRFLATGAYLNLGYSPPYLPHVVGSPQRRLADHLADGLEPRLSGHDPVRLLDVGCGRGGPAIRFAERLDAAVLGVDLVAFNAALAAANARQRGLAWPADGAIEGPRRRGAAFVVGDATRLPVPSGAVDACTAVDAAVYVPETAALFGELSRVLRPGGVLAVSDLLVADDPDDPDAVAAFAEAWDMPPPSSPSERRAAIEAAGFRIDATEDVTANSVGRFGKWSALYLALVAVAGGAVHRLLARWGIDGPAVTEQVRAAHAALADLRHVVIHATRRA